MVIYSVKYCVIYILYYIYIWYIYIWYIYIYTYIHTYIYIHIYTYIYMPWGSDHLLREWSAKLSLRMVLDPKCLLEWPSLSGRQLAQGGWQRGSISSFFGHQSTRNNSWHGASSDSFKALHLIQCTRVKSSSTWLLFQGFSGFEDMVPMATLVWLVWGCFEMQRCEVRPARCRLLMAGWFLN